MNKDLMGTRHRFLAMLECMLDERVLTGTELSRYVDAEVDENDPDCVRKRLEDWYRGLGIEAILRRRFSLSPCPFSADEIAKATENDETILCVPGGVSRQQLAALFRLDTWAVHDPIATRVTEPEDLWFRTALTPQPSHLRSTGLEIKHSFLEAGRILFSLERYLVFIGRYLTLRKRLPDDQYWIWLPEGAYDRSGMLVAGFDRRGSLSVHGWMPHFSASFLGARYGYAAET